MISYIPVRFSCLLGIFSFDEFVASTVAGSCIAKDEGYILLI